MKKYLKFKFYLSLLFIMFCSLSYSFAISLNDNKEIVISGYNDTLHYSFNGSDWHIYKHPILLQNAVSELSDEIYIKSSKGTKKYNLAENAEKTALQLIGYQSNHHPIEIEDNIINLQQNNIDNNELAFFKNTYDQCRISFINSIENLKSNPNFKDVNMGSIPIKAYKTPKGKKFNKTLYIDWAYIPSRNKSKEHLAIITSGLHGIEGYAGSAIQNMFVDLLLPNLKLQNTAILLVHGVNPYGLNFYRRATENNVDLNRNFLTKPPKSNNSYEKMKKLFQYNYHVSYPAIASLEFYSNFIYYYAKYGEANLREATLTGQYSHCDGIFYGGTFKKPEQQEKLLLDLFFNTIEINSFKKVMVIDLHTGYGVKNKLQFYPPPVTKNNKTAVESVFGNIPGHKIEWPDPNKEGNYIIQGGFLHFWESTLDENKIYVPMTFEFGTMNTQTILGGIKSLKTTVLENRAVINGNYSDKHIRNSILDLYYPSSTKWRISVINSAKSVIPKVLNNFSKL